MNLLKGKRKFQEDLINSTTIGSNFKSKAQLLLPRRSSRRIEINHTAWGRIVINFLVDHSRPKLIHEKIETCRTKKEVYTTNSNLDSDLREILLNIFFVPRWRCYRYTVICRNE